MKQRDPWDFQRYSVVSPTVCLSTSQQHFSIAQRPYRIHPLLEQHWWHDWIAASFDPCSCIEPTTIFFPSHTIYIYIYFIAYGLSSVGLESQMSTALLVNTISYAANHKPFKHRYRKLQSLFSYSWSKPIYQTHNDALKQYLYIALSYTNCCILFFK